MRAVQIGNVRGLLGIRRMDKIPNARINDLWGVRKSLDERIDESVLRYFGHVERMKKHRIAKRVYVGECAGNRSVGRPRRDGLDWIGVFKEKRFGCQASKENGPG